MISQVEGGHHILGRRDIDAKFDQTMAKIMRIESTRFTNREQKLMCAVIIQKTGYAVMKRLYQGEHFALCVRILKAGLSKCGAYSVSSECIQLLKLIIMLHSTDHAGAFDDNAFDKGMKHSHVYAYIYTYTYVFSYMCSYTYAFYKGGHGLLANVRNIITNDFFLADPHEYAYSNQYAIDNYKYLRHIKKAEIRVDSYAADKEAKRLRLVKNTITDTLKQTSLGKYIMSIKADYSALMKWQGVIGNVLPFKPLVHGLSANSEKQAYKTFELLQCYMGDRPITMMPR